MAQCPFNIGFETGSFLNWECSTGIVDHNGDVHMLQQGVIDDRHAIMSRSAKPALDPYGRFPVLCPNGSKYSVKLGNDHAGSQAERVSYTFIVPANQSDYSIIYNYAVVFQDPGHFPFQQPHFTAKVFDVASNQYIQCSSFDFIASGNLPGFKLADTLINGLHYNVYYKPWALATIKLAGYAGKTIRLEFTTNDCTEGEHFGYAYIDVNTTCQPTISGTNYCNGSQLLTLTAPYGYQKYSWYDAGLTTLIDTTSTLRIKPPPAAGTVYGLIVNPYPGSGCLDTLYAVIKYDNTPFVFTAPDSARFCLPFIGDLTSPTLTAGSSPGLVFSYYSDSLQQSFIPKPDSIKTNGLYYIKALDTLTGCMGVREVNVAINNSPNITITSPAPVRYPAKSDLTSSSVLPGDLTNLAITYWKNAVATIPLLNPNTVDTAGTYYIKVTNAAGCSIMKPVKVVIAIAPPPNIFSPNGDGIHDTWEIPGLKQNPECEVNIYNRSGQLVFHSAGYGKSWDGEINGKAVPVGTYYYVIKVSSQLSPVAGYVDVIY